MSNHIHECGLIQSILVNFPFSRIGLLLSNSAAKAWCAIAGTAAATRPTKSMAAIVTFITFPSVNAKLRTPFSDVKLADERGLKPATTFRRDTDPKCSRGLKHAFLANS